MTFTRLQRLQLKEIMLVGAIIIVCRWSGSSRNMFTISILTCSPTSSSSSSPGSSCIILNFLFLLYFSLTYILIIFISNEVKPPVAVDRRLPTVDMSKQHTNYTYGDDLSVLHSCFVIFKLNCRWITRPVCGRKERIYFGFERREKLMFRIHLMRRVDAP